jgi:hypothetical protein
MYIFGIILLTAGALLLIVFSPWTFLDPGGATGLIDLTELFWYAQWTGLWLVLGSLLCFGVAARRMPFDLASRAAIAPGLAVLLVVLFLAFSMPEASNQREWHKGVLGLPVYIKTKLRLAADAKGVEGLPVRFAGTWKSGRDPVVGITESVMIHNGAAHKLISKNTCPHRFLLEYRFAPPSGLFEFFRYAGATEADFRTLSNRDYPVLIADCGMDFVVFVLLERRKLLFLAKNAQPQILNR